MLEDLLLDVPDSAAMLTVKGDNFASLPLNQMPQFSCVEMKLGIESLRNKLRIHV